MFQAFEVYRKTEDVLKEVPIFKLKYLKRIMYLTKCIKCWFQFKLLKEIVAISTNRATVQFNLVLLLDLFLLINKKSLSISKKIMVSF
jgi:hypothetical protein